MTSPFFESFDPSLSLVTHFTRQAYGVTSPFGRSPSLPLSGISNTLKFGKLVITFGYMLILVTNCQLPVYFVQSLTKDLWYLCFACDVQNHSTHWQLYNAIWKRENFVKLQCKSQIQMYVFTFFFGHDIFEVCQNFIGINHVIILRYH